MVANTALEHLQDITQAVRLLVKAEKGLRCSTSDEFLLRFIKASNYDVQLSHKLVRDYFRAKVESPEAFVVQSPAANESTLKRLDLGYTLAGPDLKGRRVIYVKFGDVDPGRECWVNICQTMMMILETLSLEPVVQEKGLTMILDCSNFTLKLMKWATPYKMRILMRFLQDCIPMRIQVVHITNAPFMFNIFFTALKPFMNEEFKNKATYNEADDGEVPLSKVFSKILEKWSEAYFIQCQLHRLLLWHSGDCSTLWDHVDQHELPPSLGGSLDVQDVAEWYKKVLAKEEAFAEFRKMGYNMGDS